MKIFLCLALVFLPLLFVQIVGGDDIFERAGLSFLKDGRLADIIKYVDIQDAEDQLADLVIDPNRNVLVFPESEGYSYMVVILPRYSGSGARSLIFYLRRSEQKAEVVHVLNLKIPARSLPPNLAFSYHIDKLADPHRYDLLVESKEDPHMFIRRRLFIIRPVGQELRVVLEHELYYKDLVTTRVNRLGSVGQKFPRVLNFWDGTRVAWDGKRQKFWLHE